jgi:multidrug resistance efflux pump
MILLMTIIYLGCVMVAFKYIKIKVQPVSVAIAILIGCMLLGGIVVGWKLTSPMSSQMTLRRHIVRIVPNAQEFVTKVHVESNQLVKKGDPIFELSQERYQYAVNQAKANLAASESTVSQLEATIAAAEASVRQSVAQSGIAKAEIETAKKLRRSLAGSVAKLKIAETEANYRAALAGVEVAKASLKETESSLEAAKHAVDVSQSALNTADYNLSQTVYRSSVDGRVINLQVREQFPVARWQFTAVGTLMDLSDTAIIAVFPQNLLSKVDAGNSVEVAFLSRPGEVASGKVESVVKYTGEGQFMASDVLPVVATVGAKGFLVARIRLDDEELAKSLPLGAAGSVAIYTKSGKPFHVISKIALRMQGWLFYLPI